ncbi:myosin-cross-reactive antigen family protein [Pochonia chlamydosporia 170]|uniref:Myosin-cross-reactive antigen family protein n=1 Tax=Pochonia chlamydosporia 170 TaxID=1380566 RepID=A0A179F248_METCM|nr:myosin-cross-reactive antigen family protein [Pochonia chlamydosporia 170]OAQ59526.1 myosin-cross-reactive antigen family protein [Pochonia chlamydosporia 170]
MTTVEAQSIVKELSEWEFPLLFRMSLQFALFKTYGIPTISSLLVATRMFSNPENASKRYEDTSVLIGEFMAHAPNEERTRQAIGRMNSLHSPYIKAGKISNEDLLYTLSVFVTEPINWINTYEWRQLTDMEICAQGAFWKSIGDAMNIKYSGHLKRHTWKDGIEFYEDIADWAMQYELEHMVPAATNKQTATELFALLLFYVPRFLVPFSHQIIGVLMGERLRRSMMLVPLCSLPKSSQLLQ